MPMELLSMIGGSVTGFVFRYLAEKRQNDKDIFERLINANKQTTENQDKAVQRVPLDAGRFVEFLPLWKLMFKIQKLSLA